MTSSSPSHTVPDPDILAISPALMESSFYAQVMNNRTTQTLRAQEMDTSDTESIPEDSEKIYTSLSDSKTYNQQYSNQCDSILSAENINLCSWMDRHPRNWTSQDIVNWIYYVCSRSNILDRYKVRGEKFNKLSGEQLWNMSREDFMKRDPDYGSDLYDCFKNITNKATFKPPPSVIELSPVDITVMEEIHSQFGYSLPEQQTSAGRLLWSSAALEQDDNDIDLTGYNTMTVNPCSRLLEDSVTPGTPGVAMIGNDPYDYISTDEFEDIETQGSSGYGSDDSGTSSPKIGAVPPKLEAIAPHGVHDSHQAVHGSCCDMTPYGALGDPSHMQSLSSPCNMAITPDSMYTQDSHFLKHRQHGKPRGRPSKPNSTGQRGRKQGQTTRGNHLWEFIRDIINDSRYNPDNIKWENKEQGIFKIVNSAEIARLWGQKKNNPSMTYEKFSRAMRDYYKSDILRRVGSRKLIYAFGTKVFPHRILYPVM